MGMLYLLMNRRYSTSMYLSSQQIIVQGEPSAFCEGGVSNPFH